MAGNRKGALKGWCTRKGHVWPEEWLALPEVKGLVLHEKTCLRCERVAYQEGLSEIFLYTLAKTNFAARAKKMLSQQNPLYGRLVERKSSCA